MSGFLGEVAAVVLCRGAQCVNLADSGEKTRWLNGAPWRYSMCPDSPPAPGPRAPLVEELAAAVLAYVERHNAEPKPFRRTKSADAILASVAGFCERTLTVHGPDLKQTSEAPN